MQTKICSFCKTEKSLDFFGVYNRSKDGYRARCKECRKFQDAARWERHSTQSWDETSRKTCSQCRIEKPFTQFSRNNQCKDGRLPQCTDCRKANRSRPEIRQKEIEYAAKWQKNNLDRVNKRRKEWRENNPEKTREQNQKKYYSDIEKSRSHSRQSYKKNPEAAKRSSRKRKAVRRGLSDHYTLNEWKELCQKYGNKCLACGAKGKMSPDHIVPLSKGGSDTIENIQPLCLPCNLKKGVKSTDYR